MGGGAGPGIAAVWEVLRLGAGPVAFVTLYGLFAKLEDIASPQAKQDIAAYLKRVEVPGSLTNWPSQFAALFDRVFGVKHWSWRCFLRSCAASTLAIIATGLMWYLLYPQGAAEAFRPSRLIEVLRQEKIAPNELIELIERDPFLLNLIAFSSYTTMIFALLLFTLVPDYFSLLKARFIVSKMKNISRWPKRFLLLVIDLVASYIIYITFVMFIPAFVSIAFVAAFSPIIEAHVGVSPLPTLITLVKKSLFDYHAYIEVFRFESSAQSFEKNFFLPEDVFFYSALFTSVWIWVYVLAVAFVRAAHSADSVLKLLKWFLDIDGKPIRSIGAVVGLIGAVFWWGLVLIVGPEGEPGLSAPS